MSLKGVKKAVTRTPHQLLGKKLPEYRDESIEIWEHDLRTSIAGLLYIQGELHQYHKHFGNLFQKEQVICEYIKAEEYENQEDAQDNVRTIDAFQSLMRHLSDTVDRKFDSIESDIGFRCKELTTYLERLMKMLTKRSHKKTDLEIYSNNVKKLISKKSLYSDKDIQNLSKEQALLQESKMIFMEVDAKVKLIIPEGLEILAELLGKLTLLYQLAIKDVYQTIGDALHKFARNQGMSSVDNDDIIKEWEQNFASFKFNIDSMTLIKRYKDSDSGKSPAVSTFFNSASSKILKEATNIGEIAQDSTSLLWKKTIHPRTTKLDLKHMKTENPVQPKLSSGIFNSAADPLLSPIDTLASNSSTPIKQNFNLPATPQSPSMSSSPWMKPLSLKRQSNETSPNKEEIYEPEKMEFPENTAEKKAVQESAHDIEAEDNQKDQSSFSEADGDSMLHMNDKEQAITQSSIELVAIEISRIRLSHDRHITITGCPIAKDSDKGFYVSDESLRLQVAANSTLSAKLLLAHLAKA